MKAIPAWEKEIAAGGGVVTRQAGRLSILGGRQSVYAETLEMPKLVRLGNEKKRFTTTCNSADFC